MSKSDELSKIKKKYGEELMHLCRELFPTILEKEGVLCNILSYSFANNSRTLWEDIKKNDLIEEFRAYVYSKRSDENDKKIETQKTPYELLEEAGYDLYECKTEEEIQGFKHYYAKNEELCTFDGGRTEKCVVFFAVKKNVKEIRREDFKAPKRQDEYGTSVMSIQFYRSGICTVSIKNRYNHTVGNPDATWGNDLDRIVPGLTNSFENLLRKEYGLELNKSNVEKFSIPGYTVANDGKYYKYNVEICGNYYCPGNVIIQEGQVHKVGNSGRTILMDYFILDTQNNTLKLYDERIMKDSFVDAFEDFDDVITERNKEKNTTLITIKKIGQNDIKIEIDRNNQIIGYENENLQEVGDDFLGWNEELLYLRLPNLIKAGNNFIWKNSCLMEVDLSNLQQVGYSCLMYNRHLRSLKLPQIRETGDMFLWKNVILKELEIPNLKQVKGNCLTDNKGLEVLNAPQLEIVGDNFLYENTALKKLEVPKLRKIGYGFLYNNDSLIDVVLPTEDRIRERLTHIMEKNMRKKQAIITAKDISKLDVKNKLMSSEIHNAYIDEYERGENRED